MKNKTRMIELFLERKGITFDNCTERQKGILKTEKPEMWSKYEWNLTKKL